MAALQRTLVGDGLLGAHEVTLPPKAYRGREMQKQRQEVKGQQVLEQKVKDQEVKDQEVKKIRSGVQIRRS